MRRRKKKKTEEEKRRKSKKKKKKVGGGGNSREEAPELLRNVLYSLFYTHFFVIVEQTRTCIYFKTLCMQLI
jgi:hypothetical protein